ncbi:DUF362 domain-containing protein [Oryzomonas japonica]|uniref:DUF362 domain-containing protein n=1 Tax=Oryzomonas japonica TaxID=2603858 RepID=A0A7J4ZV38_9BACT|nr:DUF362 domain-containing protein [Oryzomonas japonica]KAB0667457.1 DUF362 domain-containing protein [Oryzomonas japonica]
MKKVSLAQCNDYDPTRVREAIVSLLEPLGGIGAFVRPGERVLLKPNLLAAKAPEAAVTTHPAVVKAVAELVREAGGRVLIGDSPGIGGFRKVADKSGISQAARENGAELVAFDETIELNGAGTFRRIAIARAYWEADKVINLPKLKTHEMMTMTCAVKNLFGVVVGAEKPAWHLKAGTSREQFARLLLEIYLLKKPALNIVDAIVAMEGNGPGSGDPIKLGALIAGVNPVAVDTVAGRLAGIPAELLHVEREAARMGLPGTEIGALELFGVPPDRFGGKRFKLPTGLDVQFGLPTFIKNGLRRHLLSFPVADARRCVLCGICRDACPPKAIQIKNSSLVVNQKSCIRCWCCRELCPHDAMQVRRGALLRIATAFSRSRGKRR